MKVTARVSSRLRVLALVTVFGIGLTLQGPALSADQERPSPRAPSETPGSGLQRLAALTTDVLRARLQRAGWAVDGEHRLSEGVFALSVTHQRQSRRHGGAVILCHFQSHQDAKQFTDMMAQQGDAASVRDGMHMLIVVFPGEQEAGQELLRRLLPQRARSSP